MRVKISVPDPPDEPELRDVNALFRVEQPLQWTPEKTTLLVRACRAMAAYQYSHCLEVRRIYDRHGFAPDSLQDEAGLERIPALNVSAFKRYELSSKGLDQATQQLSSSGTGGRSTKVWRDEGTRWRSRRMFTGLAAQLGFTSRRPASYLVFTHKPRASEDVMVAATFARFMDFAPATEVFHAVESGPSGNWVLRKEQAAAKLADYVREGQPVRIMGLPSFIHETLPEITALGPLQLPPDSWVFTGGGWKTRQDRSVPPEDFRTQLAGIFGLRPENIRDRFGMAEHGIPYMQCPRHRFHVPAYSRVWARDPVTLEILPRGRSGLLEFLTPINSMMPTLAILSTDLGVVEAEACGCGLNSPTFTPQGRGGLSQYETCALRMLDRTSNPRGRDIG
jgi:phenylacetate-coenzyme A ligase PaaK-like adenylate-forming protein